MRTVAILTLCLCWATVTAQDTKSTVAHLALQADCQDRQYRHFENPEHDFPKMLVYSLSADGVLADRSSPAWRGRPHLLRRHENAKNAESQDRLRRGSASHL